jgi:hypothetical protein
MHRPPGPWPARQPCMRPLLLPLIACLAFAGPAAAGSMPLALQLVRLLKYDQQHQEYQRQCLAGAKSTSAEKFLNIDPVSPGLVRPGTKYWLKVVAAYDEYFRQACARPRKEEFMAAVASGYAKALTDDELRRIIRFYATPLGARMVAANKEAADRIYAAWSTANSTTAVEATQAFYAKVRAIQDEAEGDRCRANQAAGQPVDPMGCGPETKPGVPPGR